MSNQLFSQIELLFWNFAIRMLSYFRSARLYLSKNGQATYSPETALLGVLVGVAGIAGLVSGYLFYFLTANVR